MIKGEGYDGFIALFTTALRSKTETIIIMERPSGCVFSLDRILNPIFENIVPEVSNKINIVEEGAIAVLEKATS